MALIVILAFASCANDDAPNNDGGNTGNDQQAPTITYTVTWYDEEGNKLSTSTVDENTVPSYTYTKTDTAEWDYTVNGWSATQGGEIIESLPAATADVAYYASVSKVKQKYTLTFNTQGGSDIASVTVEYGTVVTIPEEEPTYEGHKFIGWSSTQEDYTEIDWTEALVENKTYYAIWNEIVDIKALLSELLSGYDVNPYTYLPETMVPGYSANMISASDANINYSNFVNVSGITSGGFGEQWNMILENIEQSQTFFNILSVVEGLTTTSLATFNNYIDSNPDDTAHHNFASGIYSVTLDFDGSNIYYVLDYTATVPVLGEQSIQIALSMDSETKEKNVRVQVGDANALAYTVTENSYTFAIKYLGVRSAFFSIRSDEEGNISGNIYEHLTVDSVDVASAAEFYVVDNYAYAVGNKANAFIGFTGYISEVYDVESGKMIGYEVMETLSQITYNTLWFNLNDVSGINSIKYIPATESQAAKLYINGLSAQWSAKKVGLTGGLKAASRRFDIEFRTQYFYSFDAATQSYVKHAVEVPMLFVQEEYYEDLVADVKSTNNVTVSVNITSDDFTAITNAYDTLVPTFMQNKDLVSPEIIIAFIGEKIQFEEEE